MIVPRSWLVAATASKRHSYLSRLGFIGRLSHYLKTKNTLTKRQQFYCGYKSPTASAFFMPETGYGPKLRHFLFRPVKILRRQKLTVRPGYSKRPRNYFKANKAIATPQHATSKLDYFRKPQDVGHGRQSTMPP